MIPTRFHVHSKCIEDIGIIISLVPSQRMREKISDIENMGVAWKRG